MGKKPGNLFLNLNRAGNCCIGEICRRGCIRLFYAREAIGADACSGRPNIALEKGTLKLKSSLPLLPKVRYPSTLILARLWSLRIVRRNSTGRVEVLLAPTTGIRVQ